MIPFIGLSLDENGELTNGKGKDDQMNRDLNENKAGNDAQVNPGLQNSQEKQEKTNSWPNT